MATFDQFVSSIWQEFGEQNLAVMLIKNTFFGSYQLKVFLQPNSSKLRKLR